MNAYCTNPGCSENGLPKSLEAADVPSGQIVRCGNCGQPCTTEDPQPPTDGEA